ncbi:MULTISPECIES: lipopolysaccharide assembly protein LapB [unclassified Polaribacter]|uniref:tetratricopeptide repeat protein n=1 Tax=unclassified Polaribacter TaxID=196858 RepID=UPI001C4EAC9B|nr:MULTISPECIES: tetratricopeptide repeat protein [unclassified Polaribacter]QXP64726.1 tetratricopeptide repeat protein [Polaribacter sp. HaHaR_3_91]QXP67224.1 tetratricopeptide repeat protein [Polaribacter sp. AHE13PA]QXP69356.1 tetratricopeptide repeat protein [Polaribacter sp. R2A056_3_33]
MKNQILALTVGFLSIASFAQKDEIKAAEKAIKKGQFKEAKAALAGLEATEDSMDSKYKAKYFFLKGSAYGKSNAEKAAAAYNKLIAYEKEIGKQKYTKEAEPKLNELVQFVSKNAIKAYNEQDYKNATSDFYLTYKLSPKDTSFLYNAALSSSLAKDYDGALKYYKELQDINYTGISTQYIAVNKETGEEEDLGTKANRDAMIKFGKYTNPSDKNTESKQAEIIKNIGYIYVNQGKPELAVEALEEARKSNPKDINLLLNQAQMYIELEKMDKFGELMKEAVEIDPTNPTLFFNLGVVNAQEDHIEEAIGFYEKAIELDPEYGDAYLNLGVTILNKRIAVINEMNENLSNEKKYTELEGELKVICKEALPYIIKADKLDRTEGTVSSLLNIYDTLEMTAEADALRPVYKEMRGQ